jgi:ATP-dependent Lon protease
MHETPRSKTASLCARITLAAFLLSLPGPGAWAQIAGRAAVEPASRVAPISAVSAVATLSAPSLSPALKSLPPSAPSATTSVPAFAGAAPTAAASAALEAAPADAANPAADAVGAPLAQELAPAASAAPQAFALPEEATLNAAANDGRRFDGAASRRAALAPAGAAPSGGEPSDDGNGKTDKPANALVVYKGPQEAPAVILSKMYFPDVHRVIFHIPPQDVAQVSYALKNDGYFIATTEHALGAAVLGRFLNPHKDQGILKVEMEFLHPVNARSYSQVPDGPLLAKVDYIPTTTGDLKRLASLAAAAKTLVQHYAAVDPQILPDDLVRQIMMDETPTRLTNRLAQSLPLSKEVRKRLLLTGSDEARLQDVILELTALIKAKQTTARVLAADGAEDVQNPFASVAAFKIRLKFIGMPENVQKTAILEFEKYAQMNSKESEAQKLRTYLNWLIEVPWSQRTQDVYDIPKAKKILDADHAGLEEVKDRVLEFLAVRKKTGSVKGAILCFVGPPGVGKTSIASGIAEALGRKFVRLSLGGVHDESVLRGHGRTYLGSLPGGMIRQMKEAGTVNPVFLLDEVDKIGRAGNAGDPTAALLEILDPEQNNSFRDRYMDVPYDLSETLFIITANDISSIPEALRDRMEIIEFSGYTAFEKMAIAEGHLLPRARTEAGLQATEAPVSPTALRAIIDGYTREAGVRKLRQVLEKLMRRISAWTDTKGMKIPATVEAADVETYLGAPEFHARSVAQNGVGLATGLAVNAYGGSTINVEVTHEAGTGQLRLRKQFGDDIHDSAFNALKFVKKNGRKYGVKGVDFQKTDIDIDFTPAGKIDGPSAGSLMATAIISELTGRPVKAGVAMTGEISARGDVLPIGGLAQKVMAAHRMGFTTVIYPAENEKDVARIPEEVRRAVKLVPARTYDDVFAASFDASPQSSRKQRPQTRTRVVDDGAAQR